MIKIEENIPLANLTTLGVGGVARKLVTVKTGAELVEALEYAQSENFDFVILGGGSNVLVSDEGFSGLVIVNKANNFEISGTTVTADSGVLLALISRKTLDLGLLGMEFGASIPGTIGAAVAGNVGTKTGSIADVLVSAEAWENGQTREIPATDLALDYRTSNLKNTKVVILSATFQLKKGQTSVALDGVKADAARRAESYRGRTAGSYFKNPEGKSAGELIDSLELKGYRVGGAEVSLDHANVFRNAGGATAEDFYDLEKYVISRVKERFGIELTPEVVKIGKF